MKEKKKVSAENKKAMSKAFSQTESYESEIVTDPFGSYTGVPTEDPYEKPIQDADDL